MTPRGAKSVLAVDFPVTPSQPAPFPWRTAALAAAVVAAVELVVLLVVAGGSLFSAPDHAAPTVARPAKAKVATAKQKPAAATTAELPRRKVSVVILNGNGRTGAAAAASTRVQHRGYRISLVGNAPRHDYPRSLVLYRPGFAPEGKRLAHDLGITLVSPLDGIRPKQLHGAHTVVILGG